VSQSNPTFSSLFHELSMESKLKPPKKSWVEPAQLKLEIEKSEFLCKIWCCENIWVEPAQQDFVRKKSG
jgi:hypothetical protein